MSDDGTMAAGRRPPAAGRRPALVERMYLTPTSQAKRILERMPSASGYVSRVVERGDIEWQAALEHLLDRGESVDEIRRVLEALGALPPFPRRLIHSVRRAAQDAGLVGLVGGMDLEAAYEHARAYEVLARERSAGNAILADRLSGR